MGGKKSQSSRRASVALKRLENPVICGDIAQLVSRMYRSANQLTQVIVIAACHQEIPDWSYNLEQNETVKISITAGPNRTERERQRLSEFGYDFENEMPDLGEVVENTKEVMVSRDSALTFSGSSFVDLINHISQW
jgi:hypothetical protein